MLTTNVERDHVLICIARLHHVLDLLALVPLSGPSTAHLISDAITELKFELDLSADLADDGDPHT